MKRQEKKRQETVFDFLGNVFLLFGVMVLLLLIISLVLGNDVKEYSVMFSLGNEGISTTTLLQFLLISLLINGLNLIFGTDKLIRIESNGLRIAGLLCTILIMMSFFIYLFKWFPMNNPVPWFMFFTLFFVSFGFSVGVVFWKGKLENKKMQEGLNRLKAKLEEDSNAKDN